jgi:hypothetical protein
MPHSRCIDTFEIAHALGAPCPGSPTNLFVGVVSLGDMGPAFNFLTARIWSESNVRFQKYGRAKRDTPR